MFYCKVDLRSRKKMINFLQNHFRYDTMNSWNRMSSYANNVKIYNLDLPNKTKDALYEMLDCGEVYEMIDGILDDFAREHNYNWHIRFNGRSGGYLVLYSGERKPTQHKSICTACGQLNFTAVEDTGNKCGRCQKETRKNLTAPIYNISIHCKGVDDYEDFEDWDMYSLKERIKLIQSFDKYCDRVISCVAELARNYTVEEEVYFTPKTRKVLSSIA